MQKIISINDEDNQSANLILNSLQLSSEESDYHANSSFFINLNSYNQIIYFGYPKSKPQEQKSQLNPNETASIEPKTNKKKFTFKIGSNAKDTNTKNVQNATQKINIYQIDENKWFKVELQGKIPSPRQSYSLLLLNQTILLIYGGKTLQNPKYLNDLHVLSLDTMTFKKLFAIQCPAISQLNSMIKLNDTRFLLITNKETWTFQLKDLKWQLNTNQLPGGLWENVGVNLYQEIAKEINQVNIRTLDGFKMPEMDALNNYVLLFVANAESQKSQLQSVIFNINTKKVKQVNFSQTIVLQKQSAKKNLFNITILKQQNNANFYFLLTTLNVQNNCFTIFVVHNKNGQIHILDKCIYEDKQLANHFNQLKYCLNSVNNKLYLLICNQSKTKKLKSLKFKLNITNNEHYQEQNSQIRQLEDKRYMGTSNIHSIPQESNQSSMIGGIVYTQNQDFDEPNFQNNISGLEKYENSESRVQQKEPEVNMSPNINSKRSKFNQKDVNQEEFFHSQIFTNKNKRKIYEKSQQFRENTQIPPQVKQNFRKEKNRDESIELNNDSSIYKDNRKQTNMQETQLHKILQKLLVYEHLKRIKLEQRSFLLQRSIKKSQNLSKLLTQYATNQQKYEHIEQIRYLKQQLQVIWNKELFYKKQIERHFTNDELHLININENQMIASTESKVYKSKDNGKINMKKLIKKHLVRQF